MLSGHSSPLLHLCHLLDTSCLEVCVSYKTSSTVIQLAECDQNGELCYVGCIKCGMSQVVHILSGSLSRVEKWQEYQTSKQ